MNKLFFALAVGLGFVVVVLMVWLYRRVVRPMHLLNSGMHLLREQDLAAGCAPWVCPRPTTSWRCSTR